MEEKNYKLLSTFDEADKIEFSVEEGQEPRTEALTQLGWSLVTSEGEELEEED